MFRQTIISSNLLKANFHLSKQSPRLIPGQNGEGPLFYQKGKTRLKSGKYAQNHTIIREFYTIFEKDTLSCVRLSLQPTICSGHL